MKLIALERVLTTRMLMCGLLLLMVTSLGACRDAPSMEAPVGAAISGEYRNLLAEAGYSSESIDRKVRAAFDQLFHGDPDTQAIYFPDGANQQGPKAYIFDVNSGDIRSEGMSYGMMIAVQLDKKAEFDAIWNWATSHMRHSNPAHPAYGYFAWSVSIDGRHIDEMPAPDGEEYFITALYFASARWGDGEGIYQYSTQAHRLLSHVLHREAITGETRAGTRTAVNLFDKERKMVRFTPDGKFAQHTDASYHLPAFYEVWARVGPEADRPFWSQAAAVSRDYFYRAAHPVTGLTPDYGNADGTPWAPPWRPGAVDFRYDAWRTAMNWSMDWAWWARDPRQVELSNRLLRFFKSQSIDRHKSLYTLDGKPLDNQQASGLVSMNATAALAADMAEGEKFIHTFWHQSVPAGKYRYYDGVLYLMALLNLSGQYRVWLPPEAAAQ